MLDGGCYVTKLGRQCYVTEGTLSICPIIGEGRGALYQSQFHIRAAPGTSPILSFGEREIILFVTGGNEVDGSADSNPDRGQDFSKPETTQASTSARTKLFASST